MTLVTLEKPKAYLVKKYPGDPMNLDQIEGVPLTFAWLDKENVQLHSPVMCKDYLHDVFWSELLDRPSHVYGFDWKPGTISTKSPNYRLHLKFKTSQLAADSAPNILALLNTLEKQLGFPKTRMLMATRSTSRILLVPRKWTEQPIRVSMYTLMIRIGNAFTKGESLAEFLQETGTGVRKILNPEDYHMVHRARTVILEILENKQFPEQKYTDFGDDYAIHNDSGIVSYAIKRDRTY